MQFLFHISFFNDPGGGWSSRASALPVEPTGSTTSVTPSNVGSSVKYVSMILYCTFATQRYSNCGVQNDGLPEFKSTICCIPVFAQAFPCESASVYQSEVL